MACLDVLSGGRGNYLISQVVKRAELVIGTPEASGIAMGAILVQGQVLEFRELLCHRGVRHRAFCSRACK